MLAPASQSTSIVSSGTPRGDLYVLEPFRDDSESYGPLDFARDREEAKRRRVRFPICPMQVAADDADLGMGIEVVGECFERILGGERVRIEHVEVVRLLIPGEAETNRVVVSVAEAAVVPGLVYGHPISPTVGRLGP